ncbi:hypothetical protein [Pseudomonas syringae]|uniref:hypothetical protein n=1 Tax=Pseudomonas syringae TaxID=317 RepID=UPI000CDAC002|nr:hypothetical protein [Pseudomonas syringae]POR65216.1 hypothetical protein BKM27_26175 [Pseudomonas syringae pv. syringae]POR73656.1 hypothetical protein BKM30_26240 [Pseudomonas syringae pv. syringae]
MWHLKFSKRDFVEFWLGSNKKILDKARRSSFAQTIADDDVVSAYWAQEPSADYFFPSVIVASEGVLTFISMAINASPTAPTPISAFSRMVLSSDAESYFLKSQMKLTDCSIAAIVAISMAEATMHSDGRLGVKQLSSAACKRTLAYAWGNAVTAQTREQNFDEIIARWSETYGMINAQSPSEGLRSIISAEVGVLSTYAQLSYGLPSSSDAANLAYVLNSKSKGSLEDYWRRLSTSLRFDISLEALSQSTREERGTYLQEALSLASSSPRNETLAAICAFIATQVAPGSLEHMELLKHSANPEVVFWYALYAGLQSPNEIMAGLGGLGFRIYRDIASIEDRLSPPTSDICYEELKALERSGIASLSKKFGQVGVVEVELLPMVKASFSYGLKQPPMSRYDTGYQGGAERDRYQSTGLSQANKLKLEQAIDILSQLADSSPDGGDDLYGAHGSKRMSKRRS